MLVLPPVAKVFDSIELIIDRRSLRIEATPLEIAITLARIEIIDELAGLPTGFDRVLVVDRPRDVSQREIRVDPDHVDVRIGPKRVEREIDVRVAQPHAPVRADRRVPPRVIHRAVAPNKERVGAVGIRRVAVDQFGRCPVEGQLSAPVVIPVAAEEYPAHEVGIAAD